MSANEVSCGLLGQKNSSFSGNFRLMNMCGNPDAADEFSKWSVNAVLTYLAHARGLVCKGMADDRES
jgi:hypothetical protein